MRLRRARVAHCIHAGEGSRNIAAGEHIDIDAEVRDGLTVADVVPASSFEEIADARAAEDAGARTMRVDAEMETEQ